MAVLAGMFLKAALYLILQQAQSSLLMAKMVWVVLILKLVGLVEPLFRLQAVCLISVTSVVITEGFPEVAVQEQALRVNQDLLGRVQQDLS
ncbi:hypothetical protein [Sodalis sp. (in: enterobacteria)]|uniref:hypothetical protein n=1 Tax=Sodalis sp. (in: enterobacteria) TaxID=1898979 RepID=UPI003F2C268E